MFWENFCWLLWPLSPILSCLHATSLGHDSVTKHTVNNTFPTEPFILASNQPFFDFIWSLFGNIGVSLVSLVTNTTKAFIAFYNTTLWVFSLLEIIACLPLAQKKWIHLRNNWKTEIFYLHVTFFPGFCLNGVCGWVTGLLIAWIYWKFLINKVTLTLLGMISWFSHGDHLF